MASRYAMASRHECRPHIFGAAALHHRQGAAVANAETPPTWSPEMAQGPAYPYTSGEYTNDVSRWMSATKVAKGRQGRLLALAIGGAGRTVVDEIDDAFLQYGGVVDLNDGEGPTHRTGPRLLFIALERKFPDNKEAHMLRTGLEFFAFTPRREETVQLVFFCVLTIC